MKKILFLVLFIPFIYSCVKHGKSTTRTYQIENGTDRNMELSFFRYRSSKPIITHSIKGKGILVEGKASDLGMEYILDPFEAFHRTDSAVIIFDNEKYLVFIHDVFDGIIDPEPERNMLANEGYIIESNTLYSFVFTEEHYKEALWLKDLEEGEGE